MRVSLFQDIAGCVTTRNLPSVPRLYTHRERAVNTETAIAIYQPDEWTADFREFDPTKMSCRVFPDFYHRDFGSFTVFNWQTDAFLGDSLLNFEDSLTV